MPEQALEIYRGLVRRFGTDPGTDLPLRVARASLAAGDLPVLRATLRAHFARRGSAREELTAEEVQWVWLRARLDQRDGRTKEVAEQLLELAAREDLEPRLRVDVERALVGLDGEVVTPERLGRALASSLGRPIPGVPAEERADAWLRLADLQRAQGRRGVARAAYGRALALLPAGARRDRARFAAAMLEPTADGAREALARAAAREQQDPWTRLARGEGRLIRLRAAVGGGEASP
jgi:tetratricopeptide (TPR) repeat protein